MQRALATMLHMQDRMNTRVHPDWRGQGNAWHRAVWVECAELVDHYGYKWWKHQTPDMEQVQLEIVDIWHFGLSELLSDATDVDALAASLAELWPTASPQEGVVRSAEALAAVAAGEARFDVPAFVALLNAADMSFAELYRQYLGKNVLNFFRQDNGYKEGTYRKSWDGREDNEHLVELLLAIDTAADDAEQSLYQALSARYAAAG